jgi:D-sedoheptulose 7-phosphate isomerase
MKSVSPAGHFRKYASNLSALLVDFDWAPVEELAYELFECWKSGRQVFLAGNGGSAGNANHVANDFLYPISKTLGSGIRAHALSMNPSILTCLGNDEGYDHIFSFQLAALARKSDILSVFSGSGNSGNIVQVLKEARIRGVKSFAVVGFDGGQSKNLADVVIHFPINDMQISEDVQMIISHMIVQWLFEQRRNVPSAQEI